MDGVHYTAHAAVDISALGRLLRLLPLQVFGPHCAALAAAPALLETLKPEQLRPSTMSSRSVEFGTLPYEIMAGATAAVDFIAGLAPSGGSRRVRLVAAHQVMEEHELRLRRRIEDGLAIFQDRLTVHSVAADRTPTLSLTFRDKDAADAYRFLAARDVLAPAGTFYAYEPFRALNLEVDAGLRVGLAPYNNDSEIDRLLTAFEEFMHSH